MRVGAVSVQATSRRAWLAEDPESQELDPWGSLAPDSDFCSRCSRPGPGHADSTTGRTLLLCPGRQHVSGPQRTHKPMLRKAEPKPRPRPLSSCE